MKMEKQNKEAVVSARRLLRVLPNVELKFPPYFEGCLEFLGGMCKFIFIYLFIHLFPDFLRNP
jgi:hypothetical protein